MRIHCSVNLHKNMRNTHTHTHTHHKEDILHCDDVEFREINRDIRLLYVSLSTPLHSTSMWKTFPSCKKYHLIVFGFLSVSLVGVTSLLFSLPSYFIQLVIQPEGRVHEKDYVCKCTYISTYVPRCVDVFNKLQKRQQEYICDVLGYICIYISTVIVVNNFHYNIYLYNSIIIRKILLILVICNNVIYMYKIIINKIIIKNNNDNNNNIIVVNNTL